MTKASISADDALAKIEGHSGVRVLQRENEFLVITFWESMDAVRAFAGADPERAVVELEARAAYEVKR